MQLKLLSVLEKLSSCLPYYFVIWSVLLAWAIIGPSLSLLGVLSPFLLHRALAFFASAYCSDDLAMVSMLSHQRILA